MKVYMPEDEDLPPPRPLKRSFAVADLGPFAEVSKDEKEKAERKKALEDFRILWKLGAIYPSFLPKISF